MKFLVAAVAVLALSSASAQLTDNCPSANLNQCTQQYLVTGLNYPLTDNSLIWTDYNTFINFTDNLWTANETNPDGLVQICNALEQLQGCLYQYNCLSPLAFLIRGATAEQAHVFSGLIREYRFRCGAGLYTILRENFPCVQRTVKHYSSVINACLQTYITNIEHDSQRACDYVNQFSMCNGNIFNRTECGFAGSTDHWWACESAYQLTQPNFPGCHESCSRGQNRPPQFEEYLKTHYKVENNKEWFKLPDVFKQNAAGEWVLSENDWVTAD
uniref:C-type lectin domain-containing protein n=1 Tax=Panagrellus redivivus TaxID=6233 RepID=A0A7E4WB08_PANRE